MRKLLLLLMLIVSASARADSRFVGELLLDPPGCEKSGMCISRNALRFTDRNDMVWEAKADLPTDGASIPPLFQPFVGEPFDKRFIKAAIVHDHYCDRHVRSWKKTHRVFYEGLVDQGVSESKAKVMYFAVYLAGPRWINLIPGNNCGQNCLNAIRRNGDVYPVISKASQYDRPGLAQELNEIDQKLSADPQAFSIEDLEKKADAMDPDDLFLLKADGAPASDDLLAQ